jgi:predicted nucleic acid-binding protein
VVEDQVVIEKEAVAANVVHTVVAQVDHQVVVSVKVVAEMVVEVMAAAVAATVAETKDLAHQIGALRKTQVVVVVGNTSTK